MYGGDELHVESAERVYRSALFVPGNRPDWIAKALRFSPDAVIVDLEDAVPADAKADARSAAAAAVEQLQGSGVGVLVRVNSWRSGGLLDDLIAVAGPGLTAVMLPKTTVPADVHALDLVLGELERTRGLPLGGIGVLPLAETASAFLDPHGMYRASPRVRIAAAGTSPRGDVNLAVGFQWTPEGDETLYLRSRVIVEARAAGVGQILGGIVIDVDDHDRVRAEALRSRQLGCTGMMVIHPSHVAIANEAFSPSPAEIAEACGVLQAIDDAIAEGRSAVRHDGLMVDYANARSALQLLARAEQFGLDVPPHPTVDVAFFEPETTGGPLR